MKSRFATKLIIEHETTGNPRLYGILILSVLALALFTPVPATATTIYFNDFASGDWSKWTYTSAEGVSVTTSGNKFLGQFGDETVSLDLGVRPAANITVSFDLFIIGNWDGNHSSYGPDKWSLSVAGGPTLLSTTFSNRSIANQAYPGPFPGGDYPKYTGGVHYSSGIPNPAGTDQDYTLYQMTYSFLFEGGSPLVLQFSSDVSSPNQETFGLDNVRVDNHPVIPTPEPATFFLLGSGLLGLALFARRKFRQF